ncbi:MAG: alpha/beta fold hydrolase [Patescibacteria group bacterium]|jgi:carboxylesterase
MPEPRAIEEQGVHPRARTRIYPGGNTGILLLHGLGGSTADLEDTAEALHAMGYSVVNMRIAGHGSTPKNLSEVVEQEWRESALEGLALLRQHASAFFILGFSFGGSLAIDLLLREPYRIRGLILVGMPIKTTHERRNKFLLPLARRTGQAFHKKSWVKDAKTAEQYLAQGKYIVTPVAAFERLLHFIEKRTKPQLPDVHVPTLLIYGHKDYATDPRSAEYVYTHLGTEQKELYWVRTDDVTHHVLRSAKREPILQKIAEFLARNSIS